MKLLFEVTAIAALCCATGTALGQVNPFSQEYFELEALKKYEAIHPLLASIPPSAPGENEASFGAHLTRSAMLLEMSTKKKARRCVFLFIGNL